MFLRNMSFPVSSSSLWYMIDFKKIIQNKKFPIILGSIFVVIFLSLIFIEVISPISCNGEEKLVKIEKGWGSGDIGQALKNEKLIKSKWFFVFHVWLTGYSGHLQAGNYLLNQKMTLLQISKIIGNGEVAPNYVKTTIPEGWTSKQIEEKLIASGVLAQGSKLPKEKEGYLFGGWLLDGSCLVAGILRPDPDTNPDTNPNSNPNSDSNPNANPGEGNGDRCTG